MSDGKVVFEITADNKKAVEGIKDVTKTIKAETKEWDKAVDESADNITSAMAKALDINRIKDWGLQAAKALIEFGTESVRVASDLEEVQNVVDVTFGDSAYKINAWAKTAGEQFGLTELQAKKFSSTIGAMLKSSGMEGDEIADMSMQLAGLTADMASFYNLDFETAFQKIRAGLAGEIEPLRQLGINLSIANLEAFSGVEGFSDLTQAEQTKIRFDYLMNATQDAQGDFERTSDSFANSMRRLETSIEELKKTIGEGILQPVTEAVNAINNLFGLLIDPKKSLAERFDNINDETETAMASVENTADNARTYAQILEDLGNPESFMGKLGQQTDEIKQKQAEWLKVCQELVGIIPELSEVINTQTGDIQGGAKAVQDYINNWEQYEKAKAVTAAIEQQRKLLEEQFGNVQQMELELAIAEKRAEKARQKFEAMGGEEKLREYEFTDTRKLSDADREEMWALQEAQTKMMGFEQTAAGLSSQLDGVKDDYAVAEEELKEYSEAAMEWVKDIGQGEEAQNQALETVNGIADGINAGVPAVNSAVNAVNQALSWLGSGMGFSLNFKPDGSHEGGLNFVPFDHYLAELHAGEGILTAEENRIWQNFKNGGLSSANTIDYDALGGVMRDNVHAGGNVYLDGNSVGRVISQQQGQSYRALQRSGWQQ